MTNEIPSKLSEDERLEVLAQTEPALLAITDRRILVHDGARQLALDLPLEGLRRIELDVERGRPAMLILVLVQRDHEPQVLSVPDEELDNGTRMVSIIGQRLAALG